jgi:hypothetical protein
MAATRQCTLPLSRLALALPNGIRPTTVPSASSFLSSPLGAQVRFASQDKKGGKDKKTEKKRKVPKEYRSYDLAQIPQYNLCDAVR